MKAITTTLYVCGGLMVIAAVMGAVDYKTAKQKGTFKNLYKDEKPAVVNNKEIDFEDYSRGKIQDMQVKEPAPTQQKTKRKINNIQTQTSTALKNDNEKQLYESAGKKLKNFSFKRFSRAALPRSAADDEEVVEAASDSTAITEN